jgi:putative ABC transport system permease protein
VFGYYLELAVRSLRRNIVITLLMITAVGVGVGVSMTMFTTLRAMSGDPIPDKSSRLFVPQIDVWGPDSRRQSPGDRLPTQLTYRDAMALMRAHRGVHQTVMTAIGMQVDSGSGLPFVAAGRATYTDFFTLFEAPFAAGGAWGAAADAGHANVVVLNGKLAERLFPHAPAVGGVVNLDGRDYRVVGVLQPWTPVPKFYDTNGAGGAFGLSEDFFIPFANAIDRQLDPWNGVNCPAAQPGGWDGLLASECLWTQFWVELSTEAAVRDYQTFLSNYASEQRRSGRFDWPPRAELHDVKGWLVQQGVVPSQVRVNAFIGFALLVVCLINAIGLMLARFGIRRAMGGSRADIFRQCLVETAVVGFAGGILGLGLTALGLAADRALLAPGESMMSLDVLTHLDAGMLGITLMVALGSTLCAGLYPTWRASRVQLAWQLKAE